MFHYHSVFRVKGAALPSGSLARAGINLHIYLTAPGRPALQERAGP